MQSEMEAQEKSETQEEAWASEGVNVGLVVDRWRDVSSDEDPHSSKNFQ